jgi:hypothetical protein
MSLTAFALPSYAAENLNAELGAVKEKETPSGYMEDFAASLPEIGKQPEYIRFYNTVFVSDSQIASLKAEALKAFSDILGIILPADLPFTYDTIDQSSTGGGISLHMRWPDESRPEDNNSVSYSASFDVSFSEGMKAELSGISTINGGLTARYGSLRDQALKSFKDDLNVTVPADCLTYTSVYAEFLEGKQAISLEFSFSSSATPLVYEAGFDNVDLSKNTGMLTKMVYDRGAGTSENALFGETEIARITDAARKFFADKGATAGPVSQSPDGSVTRSYQITFNNGKQGMWIVFDQTPLNDSGRGFMEIFITDDGNVLGYAF